MINGDRVKQVRELRGLRQVDLAERLGVTQAAVARIEAGRLEPSSELLGLLALQTGFSPSFFREAAAADFPLGSLLFRSQSSMTVSARSKAHRYGQVLFEIAYALLGKVNWPPLRLPRLVDEDPVTAARVTRAGLGLSPDSPVPAVVDLLERAGVLVLAIPVRIAGGDAYSVWAGKRLEMPVLVLGGNASGDRIRFTVSHEVKHLVLDGSVRGKLTEVERAADRFAAELLMPEEAVRQVMLPPVTLTSLAALKPRWGVSIQALLVRARDLGVVNPRQYQYLYRQLSSRGWRTREPHNLDIRAEKPRGLRKMAELLYGNPIDFRRLASDVGYPAPLVRDLLDAHLSSEELRGSPRAGRRDREEPIPFDRGVR